jgi:hypothetical protein
LLQSLGAVRQALQQIAPATKMRDCFQVRRVLHGLLASAIPRRDSLSVALRLRIVMRQHFGLAGRYGGKLPFYDLCNAQVVLLPGPLEEGLIGGVLN